jgi:hypothetical protein
MAMKMTTACAFGVALAVSAAEAQDLASEAAFTINFTSTVINGEPMIKIGPSREAGIYEGVLTASNGAGKGLLHNLTGHCLGGFELDTEAGTFEEHGHCAYTDADGDQVWEQFDFASQPLASVQMASGRWLGGTGKYEGIRGEFEIRVRSLRPATKEFGQVIGSKQGSYRITTRN